MVLLEAQGTPRLMHLRVPVAVVVVEVVALTGAAHLQFTDTVVTAAVATQGVVLAGLEQGPHPAVLVRGVLPVCRGSLGLRVTPARQVRPVTHQLA